MHLPPGSEVFWCAYSEQVGALVTGNMPPAAEGSQHWFFVPLQSSMMQSDCYAKNEFNVLSHTFAWETEHGLLWEMSHFLVSFRRGVFYFRHIVYTLENLDRLC